MEVEYRVLLVEDEAPLRRSLENFLDRAGYAYDACGTSREALKLVEKFQYDAVIAEYHLPDGNGAVLLERLMRKIPCAATILISEFDFQVVATELVRVRVNVRSFLKKPFDLAELETALSSARSEVVSRMKMLVSGGSCGYKVCLPPFLNRDFSEVDSSSYSWNSRG